MDKQKHPIDDLFREALKDLREEPSTAGREAFLKEGEREFRKSGQRKWWLLLPLLFVILATVGTGTWFLLSSSHPEQNTVVTPAPPAVTTAVPESSSVSVNKIPIERTSEEFQTTREHRTNITSEITIPKSTAAAISPATVTSEENNQPPVVTEPQVPARVEPASIPHPDTTKASEVIAQAIPAPDTLIQADSVPQTKAKKSSLQRENTSLNLGVNYIPEWMFNTLEGDKYVNNFGVEGSFRFGRYSIRTGVGLSITKGTNELAIGYNEYLGSYQDLDSIQFTWDEQHTQLLPTFYTTEQNVWDSLVKIEDNKVIKRYTYLQIPLVLGYDFIQKGWFSMGVRTGPVLSLLLSSKQLSANYDPGKDKIVMINEITPDRIQTNWQVMAGINFSFLLNKRWSIELEPEGRYYFNSVYEKSDITKKPWSVGIRAAVLFDLKK